jgi:hypothetical protein
VSGHQLTADLIRRSHSSELEADQAQAAAKVQLDQALTDAEFAQIMDFYVANQIILVALDKADELEVILRPQLGPTITERLGATSFRAPGSMLEPGPARTDPRRWTIGKIAHELEKLPVDDPQRLQIERELRAIAKRAHRPDTDPLVDRRRRLELEGDLRRIAPASDQRAIVLELAGPAAVKAAAIAAVHAGAPVRATALRFRLDEATLRRWVKLTREAG